MTASVLTLPRQIARPSVRRLLMALGWGMSGQSVDLGLGTGQASAAAGNGLLNNLVAYWGLDEAGGANNALDLHSNGLTLTQASSPGAAAGKVYATARTFDGSADYFSRASESLLQTGDVDFALAAWVYLNAKSSYNHIFSKWGLSNGEYLLRYNGGATDRFLFVVAYGAGTSFATATANTFGAPPTGAWYLIVAMHDATVNTISICINNGALDITSHSGGVYVGANALNLASQISTATLTWNGRIGPVAFWKGRTLDAAARDALWNGGAGLAYASFTT